MARSVRTPMPIDAMTPAHMVPKHLTKQEFSKRLYSLMLSKGWHQSELARQSGLKRDSISTYVRGRSLPTPQNIEALAKAFGIEPNTLLPNQMENGIDEENPTYNIQMTNDGTKGWVRLNRLMSMEAIMQITEIVRKDNVSYGDGSRSSSAMQPIEGETSEADGTARVSKESSRSNS